MRPASLSELQREFKRYLLFGDNGERLQGRIAPFGETPSTARLDVYRNAYYTRLQDALAHDFPALLAFAGDRAFGQLCTAYLADHPSRRPSLRWLGEKLPGWLRLRAQLPTCADLAALEWALLHAFDAADAPAMEAGVLANLPAEHWPGLHLSLHPSVSLIEARANVREIWLAARRSAPLPDAREERQWLVVWRSSRGPSAEVVSRECHRMLSAIARGESLGTASAALTDTAAAETIPSVVAACLHTALARGWLAA